MHRTEITVFSKTTLFGLLMSVCTLACFPADSRRSLQNSAGVSGEIKIIDVQIPGVHEPYNASLVVYQDHYLLAFRYDKNKYNYDDSQKDKVQQAYIGLVELDSTFKVRSAVTTFSSERGTKTSSQTEDPRLFTWQDKIYLMYNNSLDGTLSGPRKIFIVEVVPRGDQPGFSFANDFRLRYANETKIEKNWTPVVDNEQLYFIYDFNKSVVLKIEKIDAENGEIELVNFANSAAATSLPAWHFGSLSGGTPAVKDPISPEGNLVSVFHSFTREFDISGLKRKYYMGFVEFSLKDGLLIKRKSQVPVVDPSFYQGRNHNHGAQVVFPGGLIIRADKYIVAIGQHDESVKILEIPRSAVKKTYRSVSHDQGRIFRVFHSDSPGKIIDSKILEDEANDYGEIIDEGDSSLAFVNLFVESTKPEFLNKAQYNWLLVNQEFVVDSVQSLRLVDKVLCKSLHGCQQLQAIKTRYNLPFELVFTSFRTEAFDSQELIVFPEKLSQFWHGAGKSPFKNTQVAVEAWNEMAVADNSLPTLFGSCRNSFEGNFNLWGCFASHLKHLDRHAYKNRFVNLATGFLNLETYRDYVNQSKFYLATSAVEGFGHYLVEGLARGAVVITTDAPPMNELVEDGINGFLVKHDGNQQLMVNGLSREFIYSISKEDLKAVTKKVLALSNEELAGISTAARQRYSQLELDFHHRFRRLIETTVMVGQQQKSFSRL